MAVPVLIWLTVHQADTNAHPTRIYRLRLALRWRLRLLSRGPSGQTAAASPGVCRGGCMKRERVGFGSYGLARQPGWQRPGAFRHVGRHCIAGGVLVWYARRIDALMA